MRQASLKKETSTSPMKGRAKASSGYDMTNIRVIGESDSNEEFK